MGSRYVKKHLHVDKTVAHFSFYNLYCATGGKQIHPSVRPLFCHTDPGGPPQPISAVTPSPHFCTDTTKNNAGKKEEKTEGTSVMARGLTIPSCSTYERRWLLTIQDKVQVLQC